MAKYRPAGSRKVKDKRSNRGLISCSIIILVGFTLLFYLFYEVLKTGVK